MGLRPDIKIRIDDKEISDTLRERLISLRAEDHQEQKSDSLTLIFDDRDEDLEEPKRDLSIEVFLGFDGNISKIGRYKISEVYSDGPPGLMYVKGTGFDASGTIKEKKSKVFSENESIRGALSKIASDHSLEPKISKDFYEIKIPYGLAQCKESDLHFASRLTDYAGGTFKINDGKLIATKKGSGDTASGRPLTEVVVDRSQVERYSTSKSKIMEYKSAKAYVRDLSTGKKEEVLVGLGDPVLILPETFASKELALSAARSKIGSKDSSETSIEIDLQGDNRLTVERRVKLTGFKKQSFNGSWIVAEAQHDWSAKRGYRTSVKLQRKLDKIGD